MKYCKACDTTKSKYEFGKLATYQKAAKYFK